MINVTTLSLNEVRLERSKKYKFITQFQNSPRNILVIEDDQDFGLLLRDLISKEYPRSKVHLAVDPYEAMNLMMDSSFDYIISDWNLPSMKAGQIMKLAERTFDIDPTLNPSWETKKINIITLSSIDKMDCEIPNTKHFNYLGHVQKRQSLRNILAHLKSFINYQRIAV